MIARLWWRLLIGSGRSIVGAAAPGVEDNATCSVFSRRVERWIRDGLVEDVSIGA